MSNEIKAKDKVVVFIMGDTHTVEVFSTDSKYIYFTDPSYKGIKGLEHNLFSRSKTTDHILQVKKL